MSFNLNLLLASALLYFHLFVNHAFAIPFDSILKDGAVLVTNSFKSCPCFASADACFSVNRTDITDKIPCIETLHLCLAGCSLPGQAWYNGTTVDEPKSHRNSTTAAKDVSSTEHPAPIEARLVERRLTCLQGCSSTWSVCHDWAMLFFSAYTLRIATCDHFFEYCAANNCNLPVQPRPAIGVALKPDATGIPTARRDEDQSDLSLDERDPTPTVKSTGTACTTFCQEGWQICVALVNGSKGRFALGGCDTYVDGCINNCYKRDLAPRAASTPVNAWAEICDIHCGQAWQVCVELVNNGKLKLPLSTCDDDTQQCQANCWTGKRDLTIVKSRDETMSSVPLGKRDAVNQETKGMKECLNVCGDQFIICVGLAKGSSNEQFGYAVCYADIINCSNNCKAPPTDAEMP